MGQVFSGIGLISGLDINTLVSQLIAVDARPRDMIQSRISALDTQRTALMDLSARVSTLVSRISGLTRASAFEAVKSSTSNAEVMTANAAAGAAAGAYRFLVRSMAVAHSVVSGGVADAGAGLPAGELVIESAAARVNRSTALETLNGFAGVQRGRVRLRDGNGQEATVDLRDAETIDDVVERINQAGTAVRAEVRGEALVLTDSTGKTFGIDEVDGGRVAADLGFGAGRTRGAGTIAGGDLVSLSPATLLRAVNDGRGVRRAKAGGDFTISTPSTEAFTVDLSGLLNDDTRIERLNGGSGVQTGRLRITNRAGQVTDVDLTGLKTIGEIRARINGSGAGISVSVVGSRLLVSDSSGATSGTLSITDLDGGGAARGLGIAGSSASGKIEGRTILRVDSVADVLAAVNFAKGNERGLVRAEIAADGAGLVIRDTSAGKGEVTLTALNGSAALYDLGFEPVGVSGEPPQVAGRALVAGLNTVLLGTLNGGRGFATRSEDGQEAIIRIADGAGRQADVHVGDARTLQEVIERINKSGLSAAATLDATGTRLRIESTDGGVLTVSDLQGEFAQSLGLAGSGAVRTSGNLQRQYVSEATLLDQLNGGLGVSRGRFKINGSDGRSTTIDLSDTGIRTVGDLIGEINRRSIGVTARINDGGDGIVLIDGVRGAGSLTVAEDGGRTARDLNLLRGAEGGRIDGSFELHVNLDGVLSLSDVAARISDGSPLARAAVLNDGGANKPYRLSISSRATGRAGELLITAPGTGLDFTTLTRAQDATVVIGDDPANGGVAVRSSTNVLSNLVPGLTLTLNGVSDKPVTIKVDADVESVVSAVSGFVNDYNALVGRISELTRYNTESQTGGPLFGDATVASIQGRLQRIVTTRYGGSGGVGRLSDVGVRAGSGGKLTFDEAALRDKLAQDPGAVATFFTKDVGGAAAAIKESLESMTRTGGLIASRNKSLDAQKEALSLRITAINTLLESKRARLMRQFQAMESALASLQSQQAALGSLTTAATTNRNG